MLNDETCAAFYRSLVSENLGSGYAVLTALTVGEEVIATLLGVRSGSSYVMVRISNAGDNWSNCSPGRLIIERTMAALHHDGVRHFDFSIGNYAYKRRFGVVPVALAEITAALSWRGWPFALRDRVARQLHRYPKLATRVTRALGRPPSREEN
jgi:CelD/BcsL family acetyltransferase involved in cellulose biosynthesis